MYRILKQQSVGKISEATSERVCWKKKMNGKPTNQRTQPHEWKNYTYQTVITSGVRTSQSHDPIIFLSGKYSVSPLHWILLGAPTVSFWHHSSGIISSQYLTTAAESYTCDSASDDSRGPRQRELTHEGIWLPIQRRSPNRVPIEDWKKKWSLTFSSVVSWRRTIARCLC